MSSSSIALNHGCSPACACAGVTPGLQAAEDLHPSRAAVQEVVEAGHGLRRHGGGDPERRHFADIDAAEVAARRRRRRSSDVG